MWSVLQSPVGVVHEEKFGWVDKVFDEGVDGIIWAAWKFDAEVRSAFEVADDMFGGVDVSRSGFGAVLCYHVCYQGLTKNKLVKG